MVTGPAGYSGTATGEGHKSAGHRGRETGPASTGAHAVHADRAVDIGPASTGAESDSAALHTDTDVDDDEIDVDAYLSSVGPDGNDQAPHYYMDVADADESTYDACDRNVGINLGFHAQLRQERDHDISTFLALPKLIPARKKKRQ